jgi:type IV pilus assembly protein PilM
MPLGRPQKLRLACELGPHCVVAAHAENGTIDLTAVRRLATGAIVPNLTSSNIAQQEHVRTAVQEALAAVGGRGRDVIAILPDGACRLVLLDFETLPAKREEADAIVRFRLKKALPFDVDRARVSYQVQPVTEGKLSVVAAVVLQTVLEEYEGVLQGAGYSPGVVIPSMLAALGQVEGLQPTLVIKVDPVTTSVAIIDRQTLVLLRTLDNPAGADLEAAQLAEDIFPSLVFYQDTFGRKVESILVGGIVSTEQMNSALAELTGVRAQELVSPARFGASGAAQRSALSAVAGALTDN